MAWIKRNLYFVITVVVGLGLTGYCVYLLFSALGDNAAASDAYNTSKNSLDELQKAVPYPSKENIAVAEADAERMRAFLSEFRKPFSGFPEPPKVDDRQFNDYLRKTVGEFGADATNAGVGLTPAYAFGFSQQIINLSQPTECIPPWMQELEEIKAILRILYGAKINFLEMIKRPGVCPDDTGNDIIQFATVTNKWGVVSPYMVNFRAFSAEIANVLAGIAASSNCFIVNAIYVSPSKVPLPQLADLQPAQTSQPATTYYRPPPRDVFPPPEGGGMRGERGYRIPRPPPQIIQQTVTPTVPSGPVTILKETPLFVTLYVNVVKLKPAEGTTPAPAPRPRMAAP